MSDKYECYLTSAKNYDEKRKVRVNVDDKHKRSVLTSIKREKDRQAVVKAESESFNFNFNFNCLNWTRFNKD